MRTKNLFITCGLALAVGAGALAGLALNDNVIKEAEAATSSVTLAGTFNEWNTTQDALTLDGDYWTITKTIAASAEFKFVVNGNIWVGWGAGISYPTGCFTGTDGSNITCSVAGEYVFKAKNGIDDYGDKSYGIVIESVTTPVYVDTTLQVTFTSDVPSYVDIFCPGSFNSWADDATTAKMTRVSNTVFSYALTNVNVASYNYKIVACYSGASSMDWNHQIDSSNQTIVIAETDDAGTVSLGERTYDFATNMPQSTVAEGAVVQLTFTSAVPTTVSIYYVGGLTNWSNTAANLAAGLMTSDANRLVFTWTIPAETYTGSYEYKIVAMSAYSNATKVEYNYLVYGALATNETLTIDTTTTVYGLNALENDLSELGAIGFAQHFNVEMATPCADQNANNKTAVDAVWGGLETMYNGLTAGAKSMFGSSANAEIVKARTTYAHCVNRYGYTEWTNGPAVAARFTSTLIKNNSTIMIVVIAAASIASAIGLFFIIKRRKHN